MYCPVCNNTIREGDKTCPKCGEKLVWSDKLVWSKLPTASLVMGLLALVTTFFGFFLWFYYGMTTAKGGVLGVLDLVYLSVTNSLGFIMGIVPIILGRLDLVKIKAGKSSEKGRGFDIFGVVAGIFAVIVNVFLLFFTIMWMVEYY